MCYINLRKLHVAHQSSQTLEFVVNNFFPRFLDTSESKINKDKNRYHDSDKNCRQVDGGPRARRRGNG